MKSVFEGHRSHKREILLNEEKVYYLDDEIPGQGHLLLTLCVLCCGFREAIHQILFLFSHQSKSRSDRSSVT